MKRIKIKRLDIATREFKEMTVDLVERINGVGAMVVIDGANRMVCEENILS